MGGEVLGALERLGTVVALVGQVGGAKLAEALNRSLAAPLLRSEGLASGQTLTQITSSSAGASASMRVFCR